jgi:hypothetical protein
MSDGTAYTVSSLYVNAREGVFGAQVYAASRAVADNISVGTIGETWHHVALVYDGASAKLYLDSELKWTGSPSRKLIEGNNRLILGRVPNGASYLDGMMDEVRLSSAARSADWIWACRNNQGDNASFITYGEVVAKQPQGSVFYVR